MADSLRESAWREKRERLRHSETFLHLMLDYTFDWEYWLGPDRQVWFTSPSCARITGYQAEEFLADSGLLLRIVHPEDRASLRDHHQRIAQNTDEELDFRIIRRDGEVRWLAHGCRPVYGEDGSFLGRRVSNRDITAKRLAEERLVVAYARLQQQEEFLRRAKEQAEQATNAKSEFLSMISHELRTPLNVVLGMTDLVLEGDLALSQRQLLQRIQASGTLMLTLINQVLDLAKIEAGKMTLLEEPVALRQLLPGTIGILQGIAECKKIGLSCHLAEEVPDWIILDGHRLQQILLNLLGNAIKFTENGQVELSVQICTKSWQWLLLTVSDTGIGIAAERLATIFDSFSQADEQISRRYGGSGLGLTICLRLVQLMGGDIAVESQEGQGSRFMVRLPLCPAEPVRTVTDGERSERAGLQEQREDKRIRILLAEDSEDSQLLIQMFLAHSGHQVQVVSNGEEAVRHVRAGEVDLLLMDVQMPVLDGFTAAQQIRQWEQSTGQKPVPIIAMTAHAFAEERERCRLAGFTELLTKPIRKALLLERIESYQQSLSHALPALQT
ncbi:MAG: response regulator [Magnetococcales bacterium]|nr:response regulator [Magnetococcales bacterium]